MNYPAPSFSVFHIPCGLSLLIPLKAELQSHPSSCNLLLSEQELNKGEVGATSS